MAAKSDRRRSPMKNGKDTGTLQVTTPSDREIAMTRVFDAPRRLVFDAWTKPELLKRWLGVRGGWSFTVCEVDLKVGGTYRFVWRGPNGKEMGMGGVYREIKPPERRRSSTTHGTKGTRWTRRSSSSGAARPRLRPRCSTRRAKFGTPSSSPPWSAESPRATTSLPRSWRQRKKERGSPCKRSRRSCGSTARPKRR